MSGERGGFLRDAFHQIAIAADAVGVVIDDVVAGAVIAGRKPSFRNRQTDRVAESLAERSSGNFNAGCVTALRMAGGLAAPLAEVLQLIKGQIVASEVEQAVEQHGAVPGGQDKTIAIDPVRVLRVKLQELGPKRVSHSGGTHRHAGVAGIRILHGIGRQEPDRIDAQFL